jgi:bacterioferritin-associated ferredoxin
MAACAAAAITECDQPERFTGADMSTKLKLMGVDVASFGDAFGTTPGAREISTMIGGVYKKIVVDEKGKRLLGGILIGDASGYNMLHQMMLNQIVLPPCPEDLILPQRQGAPVGLGVDMLPASAKVCSCENVSKSAICDAIRSDELTTVGAIKACTKAGTGCGGCVPMLNDILKAEMKRAGKKVTNHLCEHFAYSRQELFHLIKLHEVRTFADALERYGQGLGCEICKPAVASILASTWNDYILEPAHAVLQDTNDTFLANIQRDGTYSVVPRVPGGEITPDKLIVIGQVAKEFDLYVKITGGQPHSGNPPADPLQHRRPDVRGGNLRRRALHQQAGAWLGCRDRRRGWQLRRGHGRSPFPTGGFALEYCLPDSGRGSGRLLLLRSGSTLLCPRGEGCRRRDSGTACSNSDLIKTLSKRRRGYTRDEPNQTCHLSLLCSWLPSASDNA